MPIYEWECLYCGHVFEDLIMSNASEHTLTCPGCLTKEELGPDAPEKFKRVPSAFSQYEIKGDNGASTEKRKTP